MTLLAILLITCSAFTHASWNFICKTRTPSAAFFLLLTATSILGCGAVSLTLFPAAFAALPLRLWLLLALTGIFQAGYYITLANSYRLGEISVAYPLVRSIPVLLTPVVTGICGFGNTPNSLAFLGMGLIFIGCATLPQERFSDLFRLKQYLSKAFLLILVTAVFITGYTVIDREGLRVLQGSNVVTGLFAIALLFITLENTMIGIFLLPYVLAVPAERAALGAFFRHGEYRWPLLASLLCTGGYLLVLAAMQLVSNVSYIVAFRQLSIPIGAAMGILLLKERAAVPKLAGLTLIFAGLVFVALF